MTALLLGSISTLADTSERQRSAFNDAFAAHGLDWHWDRDEYRAMLTSAGGRERIARHAEEHGVEVDAGAIHATKSRLFQQRLNDGGVEPRPGVVETVRTARAAGHPVALVTTTSNANVGALLAGLGPHLSPADFDVIITADEVTDPKPHPTAYLRALSLMGVSADNAVAVEDNVDGVVAATTAGVVCVALPNENTAEHDFSTAARVVDMLDAAVLEVAADTKPHLRPVTPVGLAVEALERGDADRALALLRGLDGYLSACTTPPSPELATLARSTDLHPWDPDHPLEAEMLSGHVEGRLLALLVQLSGAKRVLDVGTFTGYSAMAMAEVVGDDGQVITCELDRGVAEMAASAFAASPAGARIRLEVGPALDTLQRLSETGHRFDLAFLDADKPGYLPVFNALLDLDLVGPGALIVADNTLLQGQPYADGIEIDPNGRAIAEFNAAVAADSRVEQALLPVRDGVTLARVRGS